MSSRKLHPRRTLGIAILVLGVAAAAGGCAPPPADAPAASETVEAIECPAAEGSAEPRLVSGADGRLYLSWIEPDGEGHALRFSVLEGAAWSPPKTVARGDDWFVNWADFPSLAALADGTLAAHWLVKSAAETYAYDVVLAVSTDGGASWSDPVRPHRDGTPTEHGFASLVPLGDAFLVVWLDGRRMAADPPGPMTLRQAFLRPDGTVSPSTQVDEKVCDCCPTDALEVDGGTLVVYRDRDAGEIRDVYATRLQGDRWSTPSPVHADGWEIGGCPVNGPAAAAAGAEVAVAWYTGAGGEPGAVRVAFSSDGGRSFAAPRDVDDGKPLGRTDVTWLADGRALVSWLEQGNEGAALRVRAVSPDGAGGEAVTVTRTSVSRQSGFPKLVNHAGEVYAAWTEVDNGTRVRTARLRSGI